MNLSTLSASELQHVLVAAFLLQKSSVLNFENKYFHDLKHSDIIKYAVDNIEFKNYTEYYHLKNEVFYVEPLINKIEISVNLKLICDTSKIFSYDNYTRGYLISEILFHPIVVRERNQKIPKLLQKISVPIFEKKFLLNLDRIIDSDFKLLVADAANLIIKEISPQDPDFLVKKASCIFMYVKHYFKEDDIPEILSEDPMNVIKYLLANTSSVSMEDLKYSTSESIELLGLDKGKNSIKIGLEDLDESPIPSNSVNEDATIGESMNEIEHFLKGYRERNS